MVGRIAFGAALSAAAIVWLAWKFDFVAAVEGVASARVGWLAPVPIVVALDFCLRAERWRSLLPDKERRRRASVFRALMIGYLFNNVLPARAGELVRTFVLAELEALSRSLVFGTLVLDRSGDLAVLALLMLLLLWAVPLPDWVQAGALLALGAATVLLWLVFGHRAAAVWWESARVIPASWSKSALSGMETRIRLFARGLAAFAAPRVAIQFAFFSALIWSCEIIVAWLVMQAFGMPLGLAEAALVIVMISVGTLVPASPGFIGTYEFFAVSALAFLQVSGSEALAFAITLHGITFLPACAIGAAALTGLSAGVRRGAWILSRARARGEGRAPSPPEVGPGGSP